MGGRRGGSEWGMHGDYGGSDAGERGERNVRWREGEGRR